MSVAPDITVPLRIGRRLAALRVTGVGEGVYGPPFVPTPSPDVRRPWGVVPYVLANAIIAAGAVYSSGGALPPPPPVDPTTDAPFEFWTGSNITHAGGSLTNWPANVHPGVPDFGSIGATYTAVNAAFNGLPTATIPHGQGLIQAGAAWSKFLSDGSPWAMWWVGRCVDVSGANAFLRNDGGSEGNPGIGFYRDSGDNTVNAIFGQHQPPPSNQVSLFPCWRSAKGIFDATPCILTASYNPATGITWRRNGREIMSDAALGAFDPSNPVEPLIMLATGDFAELGFFSTPRSKAQLYAYERFLGTKYGIALGTQTGFRRLLYAGNSLVALGPAWPDNLRASLADQNVVEILQGIDAQTTSEMIVRDPSRIDALLDPDVENVLIWWEGINDMFVGGFTAAQCVTHAQTWAAARVAAAAAAHARLTVVMMNAHSQANMSDANRAIYNPAIIAGAGPSTYLAVDLSTDPNIGANGANMIGGNPNAYYLDVTHLTALGDAQLPPHVHPVVDTIAP